MPLNRPEIDGTEEPDITMTDAEEVEADIDPDEDALDTDQDKS